MSEVSIWTICELTVAVIAGCMPSLRLFVEDKRHSRIVSRLCHPRRSREKSSSMSVSSDFTENASTWKSTYSTYSTYADSSFDSIPKAEKPWVPSRASLGVRYPVVPRHLPPAPVAKPPQRSSMRPPQTSHRRNASVTFSIDSQARQSDATLVEARPPRASSRPPRASHQRTHSAARSISSFGRGSDATFVETPTSRPPRTSHMRNSSATFGVSKYGRTSDATLVEGPYSYAIRSETPVFEAPTAVTPKLPAEMPATYSPANESQDSFEGYLDGEDVIIGVVVSPRFAGRMI